MSVITFPKLSPEIEAKIASDTETRLDSEGKPLHPENDYERHLYSRCLRARGLSRESIEQELLRLGLNDVSINKRKRYINDILDSVLVGFGDLPAYREIREG